MTDLSSLTKQNLQLIAEDTTNDEDSLLSQFDVLFTLYDTTTSSKDHYKSETLQLQQEAEAKEAQFAFQTAELEVLKKSHHELLETAVCNIDFARENQRLMQQSVEDEKRHQEIQNGLRAKIETLSAQLLEKDDVIIGLKNALRSELSCVSTEKATSLQRAEALSAQCLELQTSTIRMRMQLQATQQEMNSLRSKYESTLLKTAPGSRSSKDVEFLKRKVVDLQRELAALRRGSSTGESARTSAWPVAPKHGLVGLEPQPTATKRRRVASKSDGAELSLISR